MTARILRLVHAPVYTLIATSGLAGSATCASCRADDFAETIAQLQAEHRREGATITVASEGRKLGVQRCTGKRWAWLAGVSS